MGEKFKALAALKKYLSTPDMPVSNEEFTQFWGSLTDEEKSEFKAYAEKYLQD